MSLIALAFLAAVATERGDVRAAVLDHGALPAEDRAHTHYLSFASAPEGEARDGLRAASRLMIASSSRQVVVERSVPTRLTATLSRIDLRDLKWSRKAFDKLLKRYPYHRYQPEGVTGAPLVIRADWLLIQLADANESPAYYELLLGEAPAKRDRWLELLHVEKGKAELHFGLVEERSGVAKQRVRWLEAFPITATGGYAWGTRDSLEVTAENDPLEHPEGDFEHDGEEWIVSIPKIDRASGLDGVLQVYLLSDGKGNRVDKAPIDLVEDTTRFRGLAEIRNPGSCIQCHAEGLNSPTENGLRNLTGDGVYVAPGGPDANDAKNRQLAIEAFHFRKIKKRLGRANEDFAIGVELVTGLAAKDAAAAFKASCNAYDKPLALEDVARELGVAPEACRNAIAQQTGFGKPLGARSAGLAHGRTIPREAFEDAYPEFHRIQSEWGYPE